MLGNMKLDEKIQQWIIGVLGTDLRLVLLGCPMR